MLTNVDPTKIIGLRLDGRFIAAAEFLRFLCNCSNLRSFESGSQFHLLVKAVPSTRRPSHISLSQLTDLTLFSPFPVRLPIALLAPRLQHLTVRDSVGSRHVDMGPFPLLRTATIVGPKVLIGHVVPFLRAHSQLVAIDITFNILPVIVHNLCASIMNQEHTVTLCPSLEFIRICGWSSLPVVGVEVGAGAAAFIGVVQRQGLARHCNRYQVDVIDGLHDLIWRYVAHVLR